MFSSDLMHIDPAYRDALSACGLGRAGDVLARVEGRVVAWSRTTETLHVAAATGGPGFFLKRYFYPRWKNRLRGMLRGTFFGQHRALAEYRTLQSMRGAGVAAIRPVAYGARRIGHFVAACFLITEEVPDSCNLTSYAQRMPPIGAAGRAARRALLGGLAESVAHMHDAGCEHGQLFWRNILVRAAAHGLPEFFFLDPQPQPLGRWGRVPSWRMHELAGLLVSAYPFTSRSERLAFLLRYAGATRLTPQLRQAAREIESFAAGMRRHESQRIKMNGLFDGWLRQLAVENGERVQPATAASAAGATP